MPLSSAKPGLENKIKQAFLTVLEEGKKNNAIPEEIISTLSSEITEAIHAYVMSALVITDPGQTVQTAVTTAGSPVAQAGTGVGATSAPGTGKLT